MKGIGIKSQRTMQQVRDQMVWKQVKDGTQRLINSKAIAIYPYSDCNCLIKYRIAVRMGIANNLELIIL